MNSILVVGAGEIGSRHLQALAKSFREYNIFVVDPSDEALKVSMERIEVFKRNDTKFVFLNHYELIPYEIDLAIISTSAKQRLELVIYLLNNFKIKYWILEKLLVQSSADLVSMNALFHNNNNVWVNMPRRSIRWMQKIQENIETAKPVFFSVEATNLGLACNSVHFIDMAMWFLKQGNITLDSTDLSQKWYEAKRSTFWEIEGLIKGTFKNGSKMYLLDKRVLKKPTSYIIKIIEEQYTWLIDEEAGTAKRSDGLSITGSMPLQSEMTGDIADEIFKLGKSSLPTLKMAMEPHEKLLNLLEKHWRTFGNFESERVPIT